MSTCKPHGYIFVILHQVTTPGALLTNNDFLKILTEHKFHLRQQSGPGKFRVNLNTDEITESAVIAENLGEYRGKNRIEGNRGT